MKMYKIKFVFSSVVAATVLTGLLSGCGSDSTNPPAASQSQAQTQFVFTSDAHYGIKRPTAGIFNGYSSGFQVNGAMVSVINTISDVTTLCNDGSLNACQKVGAIDFVVEGGDISNRSEGTNRPATPTTYQNAATTWAQFKTDYIDGLTLRDKTGSQSPLYIMPGNHDVSNAIGYYKTPMNAADGSGLDATSYTQIYNLMMKPATALTNQAFTGATPTFATAASSYINNRVN